MLYAHIDRDGDAARRQTLSAHAHSCARIAAASAADIGAPQLAALAALLHDMGKAKPAFQHYLCEENEAARRALRGRINHSAAGARYLAAAAPPRDPLGLLCAQLTALCVLGHHSGLPDCLTPDGEPEFAQRCGADAQANEAQAAFFAEVCTPAEAAALWQQALHEAQALFAKLHAQQISVAAHKDLAALLPHFGTGLLARYVFSCLIDADRYDTYCFAANLAPAQSAPPPWEMLCARLEGYLAAFAHDTPIRRLRSEIADSCLAAAPRAAGQVYRLALPTGAGKTLSGLRFALHHAKKHQLAHVFYIIPYTTIIDQNAKVIRQALGNYEGILEHHSAVLPETEGADEADLAAAKLLTERWDAPVVLTTMVQFLNALFAGSTKSARRMHALARSVIIFDEIQAMPLKCTHLFNLAVQFLTKICGATVVLCTATQPQLGRVPLPLPLAPGCDLVADYAAHFRAFRRTEVTDLTRQPMNTAALADFVAQRPERSVLAVVNTRSAAQTLYEAVRTRAPAAKLFLLSNHLCGAHRLQVLEAVRALLSPACTERVILVSTQLIEAGVDLSVECAVRSLAGLDSIAQTAGRCNRNGEAALRPVFVVHYDAEKLDRLPDIRRAQKACLEVMDLFRKGPGAFENDLLSPRATALYYERLYQQQEDDLLSYPAPQIGETLIRLLGANERAVGEYQKQGGVQGTLRQSFATAGHLFAPIDDNSFTVVVPYNDEARALAAQLAAGVPLAQLGAVLRKAQRYAVNIYAYQKKALEDAQGLATAGDVFLLNEGFYRADTGFCTERAPMPLLEI